MLQRSPQSSGTPDSSPEARKRLVPPPGEDFWVFGYGSLMWDPGFPHIEVRVARLRGYHRRFCVYSHRYRGTPECPGLVLGLDRGGSCRGLVFRVPAAEGEGVLDYLHEREMITGVYIPTWLGLETAQGPVTAAGFVVDRAHAQYTGRLSPEQTAELIVQGHGARGPCTDYLANTVRHLDGLGLGAGPLKRLLRLVEARCQP
jgi:cation transport protein ChaC